MWQGESWARVYLVPFPILVFQFVWTVFELLSLSLHLLQHLELLLFECVQAVDRLVAHLVVKRVY